MTRTWIVNLIIATLSFVVVFSLSVVSNTMLTTMIRSVVTFFFFLTVTHFFQLMYSYVLDDSHLGHSAEPEHYDDEATFVASDPSDKFEPFFDYNKEKLNEEDIGELLEGLSSEEVNKVVTYIRSMMNN